MSSWHSYTSIYALGHKAIEELLLDEVIGEEKIDGSQFSFGKFGTDIRVRSKGKEMILEAPENMFLKAVEIVKSLDLHDGWTYRGEYLSKPHHHTLNYTRVPKGNIILFDINIDEESYLSYKDKKQEADRLGLEVVPLLFEGKLSSANELLSLLEKDSVLGGTKIEGVVIKNYQRFGKDKKVLMGKYVSEAFKEAHKTEWKAANPGPSDVVQTLILNHKTEARWLKAIQHLREKGEITDSPKDIGPLMKEIQQDIKKECEDEIKEALYKWAIDNITRGCLAGFPDWYKKKLLGEQFDTPSILPN